MMLRWILISPGARDMIVAWAIHLAQISLAWRTGHIDVFWPIVAAKSRIRGRTPKDNPLIVIHLQFSCDNHPIFLFFSSID
jgi:hypothetical protein